MICEFKSLAKSNNKVPKQKINYSMADENVKLRSMKFRLDFCLLQLFPTYKMFLIFLF